MNTKYKHTLDYIHKRCDSSYAQGYKKGLKESFAKGLIVGLFIGLITMIGVVLWLI